MAAGARVVGAPVDREWGGYSGYVALAMVAEFEADLARARTHQGMAVAKAKGRLRGKQPKLSPAQEKHLVELYWAGQHTTAELAALFTVARSTVYRAVERAGGTDPSLVAKA